MLVAAHRCRLVVVGERCGSKGTPDVNKWQKYPYAMRQLQAKRLPLFMLVGGTYGSALSFGNSCTFNSQVSARFDRGLFHARFDCLYGPPWHGRGVHQSR